MFSARIKCFLPRPRWFVFQISLLLLVAGCQPNQKTSGTDLPESSPSPALTNSAAPTEAPAKVASELRVAVRIKAGSPSPVTDTQGNVWLADQGFEGGDVVERPDLVITNTVEPELYRSERFSMTSFSWSLTNGNYLTKLHFCETYEGITGPGQRVFSFNVQGHDFKDFDVWTKAGGSLTALIETVPVEIKDGKLLITFTSNIENPQINGIEIIPQP